MSQFLSDGGKNHYQVLGLSPPTLDVKYGDGDIRTAYRKRARALHPDKNINDASATAKFNELQISFDFLSDSLRRAEYDAGILEIEKRRARIKAMSSEKKRFARELRERERAATTAEQDKEHLRQHFRQANLAREMASNRQILTSLKERQDRLQKEADALLLPTPSTVQPSTPSGVSTVSSDSYFVLKLAWDSITKEITETHLRKLVEAFRPFKISKHSVKQGFSHIIFYDESLALKAAFALCVVDEDAPMLFHGRVIKKSKKAGNTVNDNSSIIEESEWDEIERDRLRRQQEKAGGDRKRHLSAHLMRKLNIAPSKKPVTYEKSPGTSPIVVDDDEGNDIDENEILMRLKKAAGAAV